MSDFETTPARHEVERHIVAAAQHILLALRASKDLGEDVRKALQEIDNYLPSSLSLRESEGSDLKEVEEQLKRSEKVVMEWESHQGMIWDSGPTASGEYLKAVVEIQKFLGSVSIVSPTRNAKQEELFLCANGILEIAMSRLEQELLHILVENKQYHEPEYLSFRSCVEEFVYDESYVSTEGEIVESTPVVESTSPTVESTLAIESASHRNGDVNGNGNASEEPVVDLIHPDRVPDVKSIAEVMFASNYNQQFCHVFVGARKDAIDEYLGILKMEQLSIEETLQMPWNLLSREIKKWVWAIKIIIRVYLPSEKRLCDQILGDFGSINSYAFIEIAKVSMLYFLNFGEAITMAPRSPEKLFQILDMYEALDELLLDIDSLYANDAGSFIREEFHDLLARLGDSAKRTFAELKNRIEADGSGKPVCGCRITHLTKYVINYIETLTLGVYRDILNLLLQDQDGDGLETSLEGTGDSAYSSSPLAHHMELVLSVLEMKLVSRSSLFNDDSLQNVFLMNNIRYMVKKVQDSDLRLYLGDEWIRKQMRKYQQHATCYVRATWSSSLSLIRNAGNYGFQPCTKPILRATAKSFCNAFEEIYKCQTKWIIHDPQLRADVQISISQKVIHAYRTFLGKYQEHIGEKHIKYTADDLDEFVLHLFEGSSRTLTSSWRR